MDVPGQIGLAGFNGVELLDGLPRKLATMDACRRDIGTRAAEIIKARIDGTGQAPEIVKMTPRLELGETLIRG